ncbi:PAS domain-containing protein [Mucilaginibacter sp. 14171R-50]|uniref:PAS domain-containing sensor histidine kinase n=1 Tax=Mucilaginibacter sp. 14171R-50 TaxID=2703789 RepID=UPI00138D3FB2|nr:PAS domain-containing protein [Mucilaginibacter sp. 14171R-50]QHS56190.1 PAS domain-containing protein [Mucilaginibacter sp. 14171R-50]
MESYSYPVQNENLFKTIIDQSPSPVGLYVGRDIVITLANDAILKVWDRDRSVIGKTFRQALPELESQQFCDILDEVFATGIAYQAYAEKVDLVVSGALQTFYFNFTYKPLKDDKGEVWGILNTAENVTELVLTRQKLAEAEERSRFALDSAEMGAWDMDPVSETVTWDDRCNALYGFAKGEGTRYSDVLAHIHPHDLSKVEVMVREALNPDGSGIYDATFRIIDPHNKQVRWLRSKGKAHFNSAGSCIRFAGTTLDISNEIKDKEEQRKLMTLIDNTSDFISLSEVDGSVKYVNAVGRKMVGLDDEDALPHNSQFIMPEEIDKLKNEVNKALEEQGKWSGECLYRHFKTGEAIPVYGTTMYIYDPNGKPQGRATIARDLRSEIAGKQALINSEHLLKNITSAAPAALWMADDKGMIIYANETWTTWTGQSNEQFLGKGWLEFILPEDRHRVAEKFLEDLKTQQPYKVDFRIRRKDGEIRWCIATGNPQYNHAGKFMGYIGACTDVTEKTIADIELQLKNGELNDQIKQFEFVTDFMPVQLWTANTAGELDYVNQQTIDYFGLPMADVIGERWLNHVHDDDRDGYISAWMQAIKTGSLYQYEFRLRDKSGNYKWHLVRALPFILDGEIVRWFGTNTDIDEQKQMQRQKDDFLGIASHELKTPVTSIKAYAQVLGAMLSREGEEKKAAMVMKMDAQLNRLTNLIGDLLDVTKINSGRILFNRAWFDFNQAVQETLQDIQNTTHKHLLVMDFKETGKLYSDKERIGQVVTNLVTNAIKYSPQSNRIIISTSRSGDMVTVCVEDFGIGIPEDKKEKVFEQFYRVSGSKQHTFPGLGLGLYISNEIIRREGGKMWVNSTEGKGSTFCFSLPVNKGA